MPMWWTPLTAIGRRLPPPLRREEGIDQLALPFALHPLVLDEVRLETHAELLEHARRGGVARLGAADQPVAAHRLEHERQQRPRRLGRVPPSLTGRVEREADLEAAVQL